MVRLFRRENKKITTSCKLPACIWIMNKLSKKLVLKYLKIWSFWDILEPDGMVFGTNIYPCLGRHHYYFLSFPTLYQQPFWRVHLIQGCWSLYCCLQGQTMFFFLAVFRGKDQRLIFCLRNLPVLVEHFLEKVDGKYFVSKIVLTQKARTIFEQKSCYWRFLH